MNPWNGLKAFASKSLHIPEDTIDKVEISVRPADDPSGDALFDLHVVLIDGSEHNHEGIYTAGGDRLVL